MVLYLFRSCPKITGTPALPQRERLVHQLHGGRFLHHQVGCIIHHAHLMSSVLQQHVRKVLSHLHYGIRQSCWQ